MDKKIETIAGERIYLREVRPEDVTEKYCRWMNDPEVTRYLESRFSQYSRAMLLEYVEEKLKKTDELFYAIILKEVERHIGNIKLGPINFNHRFADVGLMIGEKDCWGKGFAREAILLIVEYSFYHLNLHRITAGCYAPNLGSLKAFQKSGFAIEGIRPRHYFSEGTYVDGILMGITRP